MIDQQVSGDPREKLLAQTKEVFDRETRVLLEAGTGVGKTKITLDILKDHIQQTGEHWDIVVPNIKLVSGWMDEIKKWRYDHLLKYIHIYCYQSLHKYKRITNMVLDEAHKVTPAKSVYVRGKTGGKALIALSASVPLEKRILLRQFGIKKENTVKYSLDRAVINDLVTPYEINVIEHVMDNFKKIIPAGTQAKPFFVTEQKGYEFMTKQTKQKMATKNQKTIKFALIERMHYIYNLPSKLIVGKKILNLISEDKKTLIFCSSIKQANAMCQYRYHSGTDDTDFERFCRGEIKKLAVVNAISEGINIPELDVVLMMQVQSNQVHTIQKLGRLLRKTSNVNKVGKFYVLSTLMTQDSKWVKKALANFNTSKIKYHSFTNIEHQNSLD